MILDEWAARHMVTHEALAELRAALGVAPIADRVAGQSEAAAQRLVQLEASRAGVWLTRNNVGVLTDERGVPVRYGLANESPAQNKAIKSSDLVGIRPVNITPVHVGRTIGQFVAREVKRPGWKFSKSNKREVAQLAFLDFVTARGGDAAFCTGEGTI